MDVSYDGRWNSNHALLRRTQTCDFLFTSPPPPPNRATMTQPSSVFILHLCITVFANNITWLYCFWSCRRGIYILMALGALYLCHHRAIYCSDNLAFPTTKDNFCHNWLKFDHGFWRNSKYFFYTPPPPPPVTLSWTKLGHPRNCHG